MIIVVIMKERSVQAFGNEDMGNCLLYSRGIEEWEFFYVPVQTEPIAFNKSDVRKKTKGQRKAKKCNKAIPVNRGPDISLEEMQLAIGVWNVEIFFVLKPWRMRIKGQRKLQEFAQRKQ